MKIAVCISGHLRNFQRNMESFKRMLVQSHDCDVFVHTWEQVGCEHSWHGSDNGYTAPDETALLAARTAFGPKIMECEHSFEWDVSKYKLGLSRFHENIPMMFYKIRKCDDLRRSWCKVTGTTHDIVVRTRADIEYLAPINFESIRDDRLHLPQWERGYNDQIAVGAAEAMEAYTSAIESFDKYVLQYTPETIGDNYRPERFLKWHLDNQRVRTHPFRYPYQLTRMNGTTTRVN